MTNIHYFYDPMCGWCYGATSLIEAIEQNPNFNLVFHPGGMIEKSVLSEQFRQHIIRADPRISALTGAHFGDDYIRRLQSNEDFIIDSFLPIKTILVAGSLGASSVKILKAIQHAHYVEGRSLHKIEELEKIITQSGVDVDKWSQAMASDVSEDMLEQNVQQSHELMRKLNISGYPTLIAETDGSLLKLAHEQYYGRASEWDKYLMSI